MKKLTLLERLCSALGENNNASYAVVAVASAKGIFRPMFTMMDKHEDYETKKYTAMREGLTEAIAIPCYLSVAWAASKIIAPIMCDGKSKEVTKTAAKTLSFVGVCAAALVIIPAACSAMINPIMDFMAEHKKRKMEKLAKKNGNCDICGAKQLDIKEQPVEVVNPVVSTTTVSAASPLKKTYNAFQPIKYNAGLTIGGGN